MEVNYKFERFNGHYIDLNKLSKRPILVDLGASDGEVSKIMCQLATSSSQVYCFEPNRIYFQQLCKNVLLYHYIYPFEMAVVNASLGSQETIPYYHIFGNYERGNVVGLYTDKYDFETYNVRSLDFNALLKFINYDFIDYLKMDIEGGEQLIFSNISHDLLNKIGQISIELHQGVDINKIISELSYHFKLFLDINLTQNVGYVFGVSKFYE